MAGGAQLSYGLQRVIRFAGRPAFGAAGQALTVRQDLGARVGAKDGGPTLEHLGGQAQVQLQRKRRQVVGDASANKLCMLCCRAGAPLMPPRPPDLLANDGSRNISEARVTDLQGGSGVCCERRRRRGAAWQAPRQLPATGSLAQRTVPQSFCAPEILISRRPDLPSPPARRISTAGAGARKGEARRGGRCAAAARERHGHTPYARNRHACEHSQGRRNAAHSLGGAAHWMVRSPVWPHRRAEFHALRSQSSSDRSDPFLHTMLSLHTGLVSGDVAVPNTGVGSPMARAGRPSPSERHTAMASSSCRTGLTPSVHTVPHRPATLTCEARQRAA